MEITPNSLAHNAGLKVRTHTQTIICTCTRTQTIIIMYVCIYKPWPRCVCVHTCTYVRIHQLVKSLFPENRRVETNKLTNISRCIYTNSPWLFCYILRRFTCMLTFDEVRDMYKTCPYNDNIVYIVHVHVW